MGGIFRIIWLIGCALVSQQARAADIVAVRQPLAPMWNWTGFYVGGHLGGAWGIKDWSSDPTGFFSGLGAFPNYGTAGGSIGGVQLGFNYQLRSVVLGLEADASWASVDGTTRCAFSYFICSSQVGSLGTLAARIGVPLDRTLLYVKAGAAWAHDKYHMNSFEFIDVLEGSQTRWGWMVGGGLEYGFAPGWSAKAEYNYLDLGTARVVFSDNVDPTRVPIDTSRESSSHQARNKLPIRRSSKPLSRCVGLVRCPAVESTPHRMELVGLVCRRACRRRLGHQDMVGSDDLLRRSCLCRVGRYR